MLLKRKVTENFSLDQWWWKQIDSISSSHHKTGRKSNMQCIHMICYPSLYLFQCFKRSLYTVCTKMILNMIKTYNKIILQWHRRQISSLFSAWSQHGAKLTRKFRIFLKSANVCYLYIWYLHQYTIHFKLSYIFGFLTLIWIHTYITHRYISEIYI